MSQEKSANDFYFVRAPSQSKAGKELDRYFSQIKMAIQQSSLKRTKSLSIFKPQKSGNIDKSKSSNKMSLQKLPLKQVEIKSWKDIKSSAPKSGYLYIKNKQPNLQRIVTISKEKVLVTEPGLEILYTVDQYVDLEKRAQALLQIPFFKNFQKCKVFRKWKIFFLSSKSMQKYGLLQQKLILSYDNTYLLLKNSLENIANSQYLRQNHSSLLRFQNYHDYLYSSTQKMVTQTHKNTFSKIFGILFQKINQNLDMIKKLQETNSEKAVNSNKDTKKKLSLQNYENVQTIKSYKFKLVASQWSGQLKKCVYMFQQSYIGWMYKYIQQIIYKVENKIQIWTKQKYVFTDIMKKLLNQTDKYTYFTPDIQQKTIELINADCQVDQNWNISFNLNFAYISQLFQQHFEFLALNLSISKLIQCNRALRLNRTQLQIIEDILVNNDTYNIKKLALKEKLKKELGQSLKMLMSTNQQYVNQIVDGYNMLMCQFSYNIKQLSNAKNPSTKYDYLQKIKLKLVYIPKKVDVGIISLNFTQLHQYIQFQIKQMQIQLYTNVPQEFKQIFSRMYSILNKSYQGIRSLIWTIDDMIDSYKCHEIYGSYLLQEQIQDFQKMKNFIQVIQIKCPTHYNDCFSMFMQIKQIKNRLQIKDSIFMDRMKSKLTFLQPEVNNLYQKIWFNLSIDQKKLIQISQDSSSIEQKIEKFQQIEENINVHKQNMDKIQTMKILYQQNFIYKQLETNMHSFFKMKSEIQILKEILNNYSDFQKQIESQYKNTIFELNIDHFLKLINQNIQEIVTQQEIMMVYQGLFSQILEKYRNWQIQFVIIQDMLFLSHEELQKIQIYRQKKLIKTRFLLLDQFLKIDKSLISQKFRQMKKKKLLIIKFKNVCEDLSNLQKIIPFKYSELSRIFEIQSFKTVKPQQGDYMTDLQDHINNNFIKFLNIINHEFYMMMNNKLLQFYQDEIQSQIEKVNVYVNIFESIIKCTKNLKQITQIKIISSNSQLKQEQSIVLNKKQNIISIFDKFLVQIHEEWGKITNLLQKKSLKEFSLMNTELKLIFLVFQIKLNKEIEYMTNQIDTKRKILAIFNLISAQQIIIIVQNPLVYFKIFYPIVNIQVKNNNFLIQTKNHEIIDFKLSFKQENYLLLIKQIQNSINYNIRNKINEYIQKNPIENISFFINLQFPLQVIYALDQIHLCSKYLREFQYQQTQKIEKKIQQQIIVLTKTILNKDYQKKLIKYSLNMFYMLIASRIQVKSRISKERNYNLWYQNFMLYEFSNNDIFVSNFSHKKEIRYNLIDSSSLLFSLPFCEKSIIKIYNAIHYRQSAILTQLQIISNISARLMQFYFEVQLSKVNTKNFIYACQQLYPSIIVGISNNFHQQIKQIYKQLIKIQIIQQKKDESSTKICNNPCIFLATSIKNTEQIQINQSYRLRFRNIRPIIPQAEIIFATQMFLFHHLFQKLTFNNIVFIINAYILVLKEQRNMILQFSQVRQICKKIVQKYILQDKKDDLQIITSAFKQFFNQTSCPLEDLINKFINLKDKQQYKNSFLINILGEIIKQRHVEISYEHNKQPQYKMIDKQLKKFISEKQKSSKIHFFRKIQTLFQIMIKMENRPIAIVGPRQSGKSLLLNNLYQFLVSMLSCDNIHWVNINEQLFNSILNQNNHGQNKKIFKIEDYIINVKKNQFINIVKVEGVAFISENQTVDMVINVLKQATQQGKENINKQKNISIIELLHDNIKIQLKKLHELYLILELTDLHSLSPANIVSFDKICIQERQLSINFLSQNTVRDFVSNFVNRSLINNKMKQQIQKFQQFALDMVHQIFQIKFKSFKWIYSINAKIIMFQAFNYFCAFFAQNGRQKLIFWLENDLFLQQSAKLMAYSIFATVQNYIQPSSLIVLQKIIKTKYYEVNSKVIKQSFIKKICLLKQNQVIFNDSQQLITSLEKSQGIIYQPFINIYPDKYIRFMHLKYFKHLSQVKVPFLIVGKAQSGKSSMIKYFLDSQQQNKEVITSHQRNLLQKLQKLKDRLDSTHHIKKNFMKNIQYKKSQILIYIDDCSFQKQLSVSEKYLKFIQQYNTLIEFEGQNLFKIDVVAPIIQRCDINKQLQSQLWSYYMISINPTQEYYHYVFHALIKGIIKNRLNYMIDESIEDQLIKKSTIKYLELVGYCKNQFKQTIKSWTYNYSYNSLRNMLSNFLMYMEQQQKTTLDNLLKLLNKYIVSHYSGKLQKIQDIQHFEDKIKNIFQLQELKSKKKTYIFNVQKFKHLEQRQILLNNKIKSFSIHFNQAIQISNCILINKVYNSFNSTFFQILSYLSPLQITNLSYFVDQKQFSDEMQKAKNLNEQKSYYISLEYILSNPRILQYVKNYFEHKIAEKVIKMSKRPQIKFIIQYSVHNIDAIGIFLKYNIQKYSYTLYYKDHEYVDIQKVASNMLQYILLSTHGSKYQKQLQNLYKKAEKLLKDLKGWVNQRHISQYLYSEINLNSLFADLSKTYIKIKKSLQNKRNSLQSCISQLNFMFKQYRTKKKDLKILKSNQIELINQYKILNESFQQKKKAFNAIKAQNIQGIVNSNSKMIEKIKKQLKEYQKSSKIWRTNYQNAQKSISRSGFAELKYIFTTNFDHQKDLFQCLAFVLGEETNVISLKKCFFDVNIVNKIWTTDITLMNQESLQQLSKMVKKMKINEKSPVVSNIYEWLSYGCSLGLYKNESKGYSIQRNDQIQKLQRQNKLISQKYLIKQRQRQLAYLQQEIGRVYAQKEEIFEKVSQSQEEIQKISQQLEKLIQLQADCLHQFNFLTEIDKKIQLYILSSAFNFHFIQILTGQNKTKSRDILNNKLRNQYRNLQLTEQDRDYFQMTKLFIDKNGEQKWLLKSKQYLSQGKKQIFNKINYFLLDYNYPIAIIDKKELLKRKTIRNKQYYMKIDQNFSKIDENQLIKYQLIIIQCYTWNFTLQKVNQNIVFKGPCRLFKLNSITIHFPAHIPLIFIFKTIDPQAIYNFKILQLQFDFKDCYEIVWNVIIKSKLKIQNMIKPYKLMHIYKRQQSFLRIIQYISVNTQKLKLQNIKMIDNINLLYMQLAKDKIQLQKLNNYIEQIGSKQEQKLCVQICQIIDIVTKYFYAKDYPIRHKQLLTVCADYIKKQNVFNNRQIISFIISIYTDRIKDKLKFIYLYYTKIYAIQQKIATQQDSDNLTYIYNAKDEVTNMLKQNYKKKNNLSLSNLPHRNVDLQKVHKQIMHNYHLKNQQQVTKAINTSNLNLFNKLTLKKLFSPILYQYQINQILSGLQEEMKFDHKFFLKRYISMKMLYCICDVQYWINKLNFQSQFKIIKMSLMRQAMKNQIKPLSFVIVYEDTNDIQLKNSLLEEMKTQRVQNRTIILVNNYLDQHFHEYYQLIPFQDLFYLNHNNAKKQGDKNQIIQDIQFIKDKILKSKSFYEQINLNNIFNKVRHNFQKNKQQKTYDQTVFFFQQNFFIWDDFFENSQISLDRALMQTNNISKNLRQAYFDNKLKKRVNNSISQFDYDNMNQTQIINLSNSLRYYKFAIMPVKHNKNIKEVALFQIEYKYKTQRIQGFMNIIKELAQIYSGKTKITYQSINLLKNHQSMMNYHTFYNGLIKLIEWKLQFEQKQTLNIQQVQSYYNMYIFFQRFTYSFGEIPLRVQKLININSKGQQNNQNLRRYSKSLNVQQKHKSKISIKIDINQFQILQALRQQNQQKNSLQNQQNNPIQQVNESSEKTINEQSKLTSKQIISQKQSQLQMQQMAQRRPKIRQNSNKLLRKNSLVNQQQSDANSRSEIGSELTEIQKRCLQMFNNSIYLLNNKLIGLAKVFLKEQKKVKRQNYQVMVFQNSQFRIKVLKIQINKVQKQRNFDRKMSRRVTKFLKL